MFRQPVQHQLRDRKHDESDDEQKEAERDQRGSVNVRIGFGEFVGDRRCDRIAWLEQQIDFYNETLAPLNSFVLPGGSPLAAALHVARTVTRRAERLVVELVLTEPGVNSEAMVYLNRLSDLLFVFARVANGGGKGDVLWVPGRSTKASEKPDDAG